jgi:hypothetical protein
MARSRLIVGTASIACWALVACDGGGLSPANRTQPLSVNDAGNGAVDATTASEIEGTGEDASVAALDAGSADAADDAIEDAASTYDGTLECDVEGGCASNCTDAGVTCAVAIDSVACELSGEFVGASASLTCGQSATVRTTCCGGCGCVAVDVYYDGTRCWEGIPDCTMPQFTGKYILPHAPGAGGGVVSEGGSMGEGGSASEGGSVADSTLPDGGTSKIAQ